jgi:uncharacterized membrane protein YphA (DoxX/SURF4 family)
MLAKLLRPHADFATLLLRVGLAAIFIVHGVFKVNQDFELLPSIMSMEVQVTVGWVELICGGLLLVGLFSRLACLPMIAIQIAAIILVTGKRALGMEMERWGADYSRVGPEYNLVLITVCVAVVALGSGLVSLDHLLKKVFLRKAAAAPAAPVAQGVQV